MTVITPHERPDVDAVGRGHPPRMLADLRRAIDEIGLRLVQLAEHCPRSLSPSTGSLLQARCPAPRFVRLLSCLSLPGSVSQPATQFPEDREVVQPQAAPEVWRAGRPPGAGLR